MSRLITLVLCLFLGACGFQQAFTRHEQQSLQGQRQLEAEQTAFQEYIQGTGRRRALQQVQRPWVVGKAVALARDVSLPEVLRSSVPYTLALHGTDVSLNELAKRIAQFSNLPVLVRPEALLPVTEFLPRYAGRATPALPTAPLDGIQLRDIPLARMLDHIAATYGVYWRYQNQRIEFYRTETRSFMVRTLSQEAQAQASLGVSPNQQDGFVSQSSTQLQTVLQPSLDVIQKRIESYLTVSGSVVAEAGAGNMVLVTDTPEVLEQVAAYVQRENRLATRRVRILFEELTVLLDDSTELALDWDLLLTRTALSLQANPGVGSMTTGANLISSHHAGSTAGSHAAIHALSALGTVVRRQSTPVYTLNRRPVTHALRTTFSYVDKVEAMPGSAQQSWGQPAFSVSQKEQTVGSVLTLLPDVQDDGLVLLSVAYDSTVAQPLKSLSFGDRSAPLQVQQITIDGSGTVQQLALRSGQVWLVSGFDRHTDESSASRLGPQAPLLLGGARTRHERRWRTVLLVSLQLEEED